MTEKIDETLRRLAGATSKATRSTGTPRPPASTLGDPDCEHCAGVGYLRRDVPPGDPDFGRVVICVCRREEVQAAIRGRLFRMSDLGELKALTFDSFQSRGRVGIGEREQDSIERAYNQARLFADSRQGWLLLQGSYGTGKTHLAAAIANQCVEAGIPTLFLTVPDLLDTLRFAFGSQEISFEERFEEVRRAPMLILDDFGTQSATEWAREKLFQILNYRYINRLPLAVTTNLSLAELDGRMRSRLSDPELITHVHIQAPDFRRPVEDSGQHELSSLSLHSQQTFGTFNLRKGERLPVAEQRTLEEAFREARAFAEKPAGWVLLIGTYGSGKTHLAAAIANYRASQGFPVMFVVVPDLLDHLRATFNPNASTSYDRRFDEIRTASLLVLDDLGTQAMTPWVREKLYQLFNYRYNAALPTVITSADDLDAIDPRLRARLLDRRLCTIQPITAPAYRGGRARR